MKGNFQFPRSTTVRIFGVPFEQAIAHVLKTGEMLLPASDIDSFDYEDKSPRQLSDSDLKNVVRDTSLLDAVIMAHNDPSRNNAPQTSIAPSAPSEPSTSQSPAPSSPPSTSE